MKLALKLAYKNLIGAGLRTWLNVIVLAFAFLMIIFFNGLLDGWNQQAKRDSIAWDFGQGHVLHPDYDPFDPFTILDGHGKIENTDGLEPILIRQASIYPDGRSISVALKGISTEQKNLEIPTERFAGIDSSIPLLIGDGMAESLHLEENDTMLLRWRDKNGTFDAADATIVGVFETDVPSVDRGLVWIPIDRLWEMTGLEGEASLYVAGDGFDESNVGNWNYQSQDELLSDINEIISTKKASSSIMYILLLTIALLAIFDTQVLSIFRRQREIGTYVALGMTRVQVVGLFTVEGSMYSILAMLSASVVGVPLFIYLAQTGIAFPDVTQDMGVAMAARIFPVFGFKLVVVTVILVFTAATIVSFLPARKISKMNPVDALKGKLQ